MRLNIEIKHADLKTEIGELTVTAVSSSNKRDPSVNNKNKHVVDKNLWTFSAMKTADNDVSTPKLWLRVTLEKTSFIQKIVIYQLFYTDWYNPDGGCVLSVKRYQECKNWQNNVDVSVYQGVVKQKSCGTLTLTHGLHQPDQIYKFLCRIEGNMVMLSKENGEISVHELVVVGSGLSKCKE